MELLIGAQLSVEAIRAIDLDMNMVPTLVNSYVRVPDRRNPLEKCWFINTHLTCWISYKVIRLELICLLHQKS